MIKVVAVTGATVLNYPLGLRGAVEKICS